jgi:hypothetical protein
MTNSKIGIIRPNHLQFWFDRTNLLVLVIGLQRGYSVRQTYKRPTAIKRLDINSPLAPQPTLLQ